MSYLITLSKATKERVRKKLSNNETLKSKYKKALYFLHNNPQHPGLQTHKVTAKMIGKPAWASWVDGEYRGIWNWKENNILLLDFGTHKEVYQ